MRKTIENEVLRKAAIFDAANRLHKINTLLPSEKSRRIRKILTPKIPYSKKVKIFAKYKKELSEAEEYFIEFVSILNKSSTYRGYDNFIQEIVDTVGVPLKNYRGFVEDADLILSFVSRKIKFLKDTPKEYFSEYYLPFPPHKSQRIYDIDDIYKLWRKKDKLAQKVIEKVKIINEEENPSCTYLDDKDIFEIRCLLKDRTLPEIFTFLHELGHARQKISLIEKGLKDVELNKYAQEEYAYKFALRMLENIAPEDELWPYLWFKSTTLLVNGLFEYYVYTKKIKKKPSYLYAKLHNKSYGKRVQKENYYYLTLKPLLFENGDFFVSSIAFISAFRDVFMHSPRNS
jgi:hypothetical protein